MVEHDLIERRILRSTHLPIDGAFGDTRVILERVTEGERYWLVDDVGYRQREDTPVHLFIGSQATDQKLHRIADRLGVAFDELRRFRDGREVRNA